MPGQRAGGFAGLGLRGGHHAQASHGDEEGGDKAAFLMDETAEKGLSLLPRALVSTQEQKKKQKKKPKQICSAVLGIMTQR